MTPFSFKNVFLLAVALVVSKSLETAAQGTSCQSISTNKPDILQYVRQTAEKACGSLLSKDASNLAAATAKDFQQTCSPECFDAVSQAIDTWSACSGADFASVKDVIARVLDDSTSTNTICLKDTDGSGQYCLETTYSLLTSGKDNEKEAYCRPCVQNFIRNVKLSAGNKPAYKSSTVVAISEKAEAVCGVSNDSSSSSSSSPTTTASSGEEPTSSATTGDGNSTTTTTTPTSSSSPAADNQTGDTPSTAASPTTKSATSSALSVAALNPSSSLFYITAAVCGSLLSSFVAFWST